MKYVPSTIAAIATPSGRGGIGIIRISGPKVLDVAFTITGKILTPRYAHHTTFSAQDGRLIDQGLALYFPAPHSYTGEDVLELQGHGGPILLDMLLKSILSLGIEMARPGEFSERAFLNRKLDLTQAEAVADLIEASSEQAAQSALRSLQGEFSKSIDHLITSLIHLRTYAEAAIDFSEEEIDFLADENFTQNLTHLLKSLENIQTHAQQGALLREGMRVVIAGLPNAGKSSLLNRLSGQDIAIVTNIPGTTRDILREHIHIDGLPIHIIDTAGLRESSDIVEQEGVRRAQLEMNQADCLLFMLDIMQDDKDKISTLIPRFLSLFQTSNKLTFIFNKIDLLDLPPEITKTSEGHTIIQLSVKTGAGIELLREHLKSCLGFTSTTENIFSARRRHLNALTVAKQHLLQAEQQLQQGYATEFLAEELRLAQNALGEITGRFLPDDLLGEIFGSFCIGK